MTTPTIAKPPLHVQFDELVSCTNVLLPGIEGGEKNSNMAALGLVYIMAQRASV